MKQASYQSKRKSDGTSRTLQIQENTGHYFRVVNRVRISRYTLHSITDLQQTLALGKERNNVHLFNVTYLRSMFVKWKVTYLHLSVAQHE